MPSSSSMVQRCPWLLVVAARLREALVFQQRLDDLELVLDGSPVNCCPAGIVLRVEGPKFSVLHDAVNELMKAFLDTSDQDAPALIIALVQLLEMLTVIQVRQSQGLVP